MTQFYELESDAMKLELIESMKVVISIGSAGDLYTTSDYEIIENLNRQYCWYNQFRWDDVLHYWDEFSESFLEQIIDESLQYGIEEGYGEHPKEVDEEIIKAAQELWSVEELPTAEDIIYHFEWREEKKERLIV